MKPRIAVTTHLPGDPIGMLRAHPLGREAEVRQLDEPRPPRREDLLEVVRGADAILPHIPDRIDAEVMDAAGANLKVIANYGAGYNNIDVEAARERGVVVTNTPDILTDATADVAWLLILAAARGAFAASRELREGGDPDRPGPRRAPRSVTCAADRDTAADTPHLALRSCSS